MASSNDDGKYTQVNLSNTAKTATMDTNWRERPGYLANNNLFPDVPIKYESPYPADSMPQSSPQSPALKRRLSEEPDEMGEKRQRVDSGPANLAMPDDDMAAILAQATAAATQGIEEAAEQAQEEAEDEPGLFIDQDETKEEQPALFLSDPHLSMRILSLPVLESLVRSSIILPISADTDSFQVNTDTLYIGARPLFGDH
jgi:hypothetical protein